MSTELAGGFLGTVPPGKQFFKPVYDGAAWQPSVHSEAVFNYVCATVLWLFKYFNTFCSCYFRKISGVQKIKGKYQ